MKVFAHNPKTKDVVELDLSIDEIVTLAIHPWRVDLFDPDPVLQTVDGVELAFSRLDNVAFAFANRGKLGSPARVCARFDSRATSFDGALQSTFFEQPYGRHIRGPKHIAIETRSSQLTDDEEFADCFRAYLNSSSESVVPLSYNLTMQGALLFYNGPSLDVPWSNDAFFGGEMFEPVPLVIELPGSINWVLENFRSFNPVVIDCALRPLVNDEPDPVRRVEFFVDFLGTNNDKFLAGLGVTHTSPRDIAGVHGCNGWTKVFTIEGTEYFLHTRMPFDGPELLFRNSPVSVNQLAVTTEGTIASRIALYDLANKQMRFAGPYRPEASRFDDGLHRFRFIETPIGSRLCASPPNSGARGQTERALEEHLELPSPQKSTSSCRRFKRAEHLR